MSTSTSRTVTITRAKRELMLAMKKKRPVFLWGPPGIGKSELVEQIADDFGGHMIDLRMALMEPTDLRGIPFFDSATGTMKWAPPSDLPSAEFAETQKTIILFLDELNSAPMATQAAAYQLILNRRIGEYRLPDNVVIVAAGNRETDKGVTYRMPAPLANRFIHLELAVNFDCWMDWASKKQIHPDVIGYLSFSKDSLYTFDSKSGERAFATPRSWSFVSEILEEDEDIKLSETEVTDLISGTIGEGTAVKFNAHRKYVGSLPTPAEILAGDVKECKVKEVSAMYSLAVGMCYELKEYIDEDRSRGTTTEWDSMCENFLHFMMESFQTEVCVVAIRMAALNYQIPFRAAKIPSFVEFTNRYGKEISIAMSA